MFVSQVGFRKGGIQLCGGLGRRTQLEVVLAALLMASLLSLFACAITLGIHYRNGEPTTYTYFLTIGHVCMLWAWCGGGVVW